MAHFKKTFYSNAEAAFLIDSGYISLDVDVNQDKDLEFTFYFESEYEYTDMISKYKDVFKEYNTGLVIPSVVESRQLLRIADRIGNAIVPNNAFSVIDIKPNRNRVLDTDPTSVMVFKKNTRLINELSRIRKENEERKLSRELNTNDYI